MSKQNSVLKVKGRLDNVSYYESGGKLLARKSNGPSKSKLQGNDRVRENMREFGGAISATKLFRSAFTQVRTMFDSKASQRLTGLLKQVMNRDIESLRGERGVELSLYKQVLDKFEFNITTGFSQVCNSAFNASLNIDRNEGLISIPSFDPVMNVKFPPGTTHCRLIQAIGVFSDHKYNSDAKKYLPVNDKLSGTGVVFRSQFISKDALPQAVNLEIALPGAPVIDAETTVIQCLGIEFYETIGVRQYLYAQNNAMVVVNAG